MLWTALVVMVIAGFIVSGTATEQALDRSSRMEIGAPAQARAVAEAGLVDAHAWFRRQAVQPVGTFAPRLELEEQPVVNETDDPDIGLVREYEIAPSLWARYEVRRTRPAEPFQDLNENGLWDRGEPFTDVNDNERWDPIGETHDVSAERGHPGTGAVWMLVSHGMVFARPRADLGLGEGPNHRLAVARSATEIRRLALTPPAESAICAGHGSAVTIGKRGRVLGVGGAGIVYAQSSGSPILLSGSEVDGEPRNTAVPEYADSIDAVFGVTLAELKSMADVSTSDSSTLPVPLGDFTLTVVEGDVTFDEKMPLKGTGILVVLGDCAVDSGSNSFFNGLLWVQGSLTIRAPAYLRGTFIAQGDVDVCGLGGDYAEINYDDGIIGELLSLMGQYRLSKAVYQHDQEHLQNHMAENMALDD